MIPLPVIDPTLGTGLGLGLIRFYQPKGAGAPWTSGIGGLYTDKGNLELGAFQRMSLDNDRKRIFVLGGYSSTEVQFYGIGAEAGDAGLSISLRQKSFYLDLQGLVEIAPDLFVGGKLDILDVDTTRSTPSGDEVEPDIPLSSGELSNRIVAVGPLFQFDLRDNQFNPSRGVLLEGQYLHATPALGSDLSYYSLRLAANAYHPLGPDSVLAMRVSLCAKGRDAPFHSLCRYGDSADLRGYSGGRYRDRAAWAIQAEIRQKIAGRLGAVVFAGTGGIASGLGQLRDSNHLPSAGIGLRYEIAPEYRINARIDLAWGKDSQALYLSLGEAF
ncbi:BamA/TamA family outer membrane protein [Altererythrobacter sp.]|uniref:BamA/TamA family outer membrane protein n=1 Tax=Altererythrobacter sp. TaxID=1872480 RepID=UPI003D002783